MGAAVGRVDGEAVGAAVGNVVGTAVGDREGAAVGVAEGASVGTAVGAAVGASEHVPQCAWQSCAMPPTVHADDGPPSPFTSVTQEGSSGPYLIEMNVKTIGGFR